MQGVVYTGADAGLIGHLSPMDRQMNQRVVQQCRSRGLEVSGMRREGEVLVLEPARGAGLPPASVLQRLAEDIDVDGIRYVALDLHETTERRGEPDE